MRESIFLTPLDHANHAASSSGGNGTDSPPLVSLTILAASWLMSLLIPPSYQPKKMLPGKVYRYLFPMRFDRGMAEVRAG